MKTSFLKINLSVGFVVICIVFLFDACRKDTLVSETNQPAQQDDYLSINDFFAKNGVPVQTYTVSAATGGSFTTPQGTQVMIPGGTFITQTSAHVDTGTIKIEFKDIYKRSDMLLSDDPTMGFANNFPLKSGGEFFIRASSNGAILQLLEPRRVIITQPLNNFAFDANMTAFVGQEDSLGKNVAGWLPPPIDSIGDTICTVLPNVTNYLFSLYQFSYPVDSGTWCNSDNQTYFSSFTTTTLTMNPTDNPYTFQTEVFLVFKNIDCMIHVYISGSDFPYSYAPQGLECTMVAIGEKNGALYSSFVPITISSNETVNFTLSKTTTAAFETQLRALD